MKNLKKLDIVIIGVLVVITILSLGVLKLPNNDKYSSKNVVIHADNRLFKTIALKDTTKEIINIETELGKNVVEISDGKVRIIDADCPDKICIHDGSKSKPGEILVCLPNKVVIEINGQASTFEPDAQSY